MPPSYESQLKRGDIIAGRYEIMRLIGKGGMSRVFLAADLELTNKQWAIKEVYRHAVDKTGRPVEQSLAAEADLMTKLSHPNIVSIVDVAKTDDFIYVVMDHVEGESLDKLVRRTGPQSEEDVHDWMLQVCDALGYLHRQNPPIIYRDMKPGNLMLHPDGYIKLIDFGVSREYKDYEKTDTQAFGTEGYAPPEQYGKAQTDARSDIYAVGATMWHLLAGQAPPSGFDIPDVRSVNPMVGEGFAETIIPKCMELRREDRYQTCGELAGDIDIYQELTHEYKTQQKNKIRAFAIPGILSVVLALTGVGMFALHEGAVSDSYESHLTIAKVKCKTEPQLAAAESVAAIKCKPDSIEAYESLIDSLEADEVFTSSQNNGRAIELDDGHKVSEKELMDSVYEEYLVSRQNDTKFTPIFDKIGRLYFFYYTYGQANEDSIDCKPSKENQATRIKASKEYFEIAARDENYENAHDAKAFADIAEFTTNIDGALRTGDENQELYVKYWKSLDELVSSISNMGKDRPKLESCSLVANAIETYMYKFKSIGHVEQEDRVVTTADGGDISGNIPGAYTLLSDLEKAINELNISPDDENGSLYKQVKNIELKAARAKIKTAYSADAVTGIE